MLSQMCKLQRVEYEVLANDLMSIGKERGAHEVKTTSSSVCMYVTYY
jgi:hypothetical protein